MMATLNLRVLQWLNVQIACSTERCQRDDATGNGKIETRLRDALRCNIALNELEGAIVHHARRFALRGWDAALVEERAIRELQKDDDERDVGNKDERLDKSDGERYPTPEGSPAL